MNSLPQNIINIYKRLSLGIFLILSLHSSFASSNKDIAKQGIIDLRDWKFSTNNSVELNGEWEFYWKKLLNPEDFDYPIEGRAYYELPKVWENDDMNISAQGFATYRLRIILNSITPELAIFIPQLYNSYILYINEEYIASNGRVGTSLETSQPHWMTVTKNLTVTKDTLDIILQVSNFRHKRGGVSNPIILGTSDFMQSKKAKIEAYDYTMAASLFFVGLFFMVLYWFGKQEKQVLYYSLFCLIFSYRLVGSSYYTLHSLFPDIPWLITFKLEVISLYMGSVFFGVYSYYLYKNETSKKFVQFFVTVGLLSSIITLVLPPIYSTQIISAFSIFILVSFGYMYITYIKAFINKRVGSMISLISSSILFLVMVHAILVYFGYLTTHRTLYFIGYQQFFFFQSIILFYGYTQKLESAKATAEKAAKARSDFLSMISHEIRTPLNAVIGLSNYLISDSPRKGQVDDLKTLKFSAENLHVLINDVLDYSKLDAGKIEFEYRDTNVKELADNIIKGLEPKAKEQGIYLKFEYDDSIPKFIVADGLRISQILTNLIGNAIKFTNKGGVTLSLSRIMNTKKKVSIKFLIEDTGIGIPKEKQKVIFESFSQASTSTTRKYGGTGLGLSITKRILDLQNTQIHLFSREGHGSRFYFTQTFDICDVQGAQKEVKPDAQVELAGKKVLLVEDNPVNVMVAKKFLSRWNIEVDVAENGREALEKNVNNSYDLILMDLQMPIMDGYDASIQLRSQGVKIPIIALTASVMLDVGDKVFSSGMNDYITKPFNPDNLYKKIKHQIQEAATSSD